MNGWKVINAKTRKSCRAYLWTDSDTWAIEYPVGVEVFPRVQGTKLFFFKTKSQAERFKNYDEIIVPCVAKGVSKPKKICSTGSVANFWEARRRKRLCDISRDVGEAPKGTYFADSITCLK